MLDLGPMLQAAVNEFLYTLFVRFWWIWPIIFALAYFRGRMDRWEERQRTERRIRDEMEIRAKIEQERRQ